MGEQKTGAKRPAISEEKRATLGGGCFWCLEPVFEKLEGVEDVVAGYAGGDVPNPSYRQVTTGATGHAEVVQITYDSNTVSFRELLEVFFRVHDPTTPDRQGPDVGSQYRSIILYHDDDQRRVAEEVIRQMESRVVWQDPIVTEVVPLKSFYRAEEYHQAYFAKNPEQAYCRVMIAPKVAKFQKEFWAKLKDD